jgi:hypothetical protein
LNKGGEESQLNTEGYVGGRGGKEGAGEGEESEREEEGRGRGSALVTFNRETSRENKTSSLISGASIVPALLPQV